MDFFQFCSPRQAKGDERPTFDLKDLQFYRSHRPLSATLQITSTDNLKQEYG